MKKSQNHEKLFINNGSLIVLGDKIKLERQSQTQQKELCIHQQDYYNQRSKNKIIRNTDKVVESDYDDDDDEENQGKIKLIKNVSNKQQITNKNRPLKLKITNYYNRDVCNKQLKKIYETVEIEDFKRFLNHLHANNSNNNNNNYLKRINKDDDSITCLQQIEDIYDEYFGNYYKYLQEQQQKPKK